MLSVTRNDVRISEEDVLQITDVTGADPAVTLSVEGDTLVLETGEWSGELVLSYTVTDGETSEVATATVVVTDSAIAPISAASQRGSFDGYGDNNSPDPDRILPRLEVPNFLVLFGSLNLAMFSNPWLLGALFLPLVALWRSRRKSGWAEVTGVPRGEVALVDLAGSQAQLRHDADEIWVTGRRRRGLVEVHVFGGSGWMDPDLLKFTSP